MRVIISFVFVLLIMTCFDSCFEAPHFSPTPEIQFDNLIFKDVSNPASADSVILTLNFKDGDGDLGLGPGDIGIPYNDKYYYQFQDLSLITYKTKRTVPAYDTLPDFVTPYNCTNWEVIKDSNDATLDTVYFRLNPYHYNIFVEFYILRQDGSGTYDKFDWANEFIYPNCQVNGFDGRFPVLSKDLSQSAAQEGKIRYSMRSVAFKLFFSIKTLKLHVWILDRALHKSNVIETDAFSLQSILSPS